MQGGYLCRAEKRLLGDSRMGPSGRPQPRSLTHCRYPLVRSAMPMARAEQYRNLYPFLGVGQRGSTEPSRDQPSPSRLLGFGQLSPTLEPLQGGDLRAEPGLRGRRSVQSPEAQVDQDR